MQLQPQQNYCFHRVSNATLFQNICQCCIFIRNTCGLHFRCRICRWLKYILPVEMQLLQRQVDSVEMPLDLRTAFGKYYLFLSAFLLKICAALLHKRFCSYHLSPQNSIGENKAEDDSLSDRPEHASAGGCTEKVLIVLRLVQVSELLCLCRRPASILKRLQPHPKHVRSHTFICGNTYSFWNTFQQHCVYYTSPSHLSTHG